MMTPEEELKWLQGLQQFLYTKILPLAEPDATLRLKLVGQDAMNIWTVCFTHESYNPNIGTNYEEMEKLGDNISKALFTQYLMMRFENIDRSQLSELGNHYMSKPLQAGISSRLGLNKWLRTPVTKNTHMIEDILEATFGALLLIGDKVYGMGSGYILCYNFLVNLYNNEHIDFTYAKGPAKTQLKQILEKMGWIQNNIEEIEYWQQNIDNNAGTLTLYIPDIMRHDLLTRNMKLPTNVFVSVQGSTKKVASNLAYPQALKYIETLGITEDWVNLQLNNDEFLNPELAPYYPTALNKIRSQGFESMFFKIPRKKTSDCYVQLIAQRADGSQSILITITDCDLANAKREALRRYVGAK